MTSLSKVVGFAIMWVTLLGPVAFDVKGEEDGMDIQDSRLREMAETFINCWISGDVSRLSEIFDSSATYDDFPNHRTYTGLKEIAGYFKHVHSWARGGHIEVRTLKTFSDYAVIEWTFTGVQGRPVGEIVKEATNRKVSLEGVTLLEMTDGRIARAADYIDVLTFVLQLGAKVSLPGGTVLEVPESHTADQ